jgi:hypothetical protein
VFSLENQPSYYWFVSTYNVECLIQASEANKDIAELSCCQVLKVVCSS